MFRVIALQRTTFTVANFLSWARANELTLSPSFQRRAVWPAKAKSFFIDTISRGLPIPIIFLRESTSVETLATVREVVDGQQRLRTLISFIDPTSLRDYNIERDDFRVSRIHNPDLGNMSFVEFPSKVKKDILSYQIPVHILPPDTADSEVLDIFRRMNATGTKLNDQELRNAEFFGELIQSVYSLALANLGRWRKWNVFSEQEIARMGEAEFTSELYMAVMRGISERTQRGITAFYAEYDSGFLQCSDVEKAVSCVLLLIDEVFGENIGATRLRNRAIFYVVFTVIFRLCYPDGLSGPVRAGADVRRAVERGVSLTSAALSNEETLPEDVRLSLASRSNSRASREILFQFIDGFFEI